MPNWEWHIGSTTWSWNVAIPGLGLMGLFFGLMAIYPFVEAWVTGDKREHHILDRPRNARPAQPSVQQRSPATRC